MALSIIGAGFGRTGTLSLKLALEQLKQGRCYHMVEVFERPEHVNAWIRAASGKKVDWNKLFAGYSATTDWPACNFYRELAKIYPDAKVILTVRDANAWFDSTQKTIFNIDDDGGDPKMGRFFAGILKRSGIGDDLHHRKKCIAIYKKHNAEVRRVIPRSRLLVFDVARGWDPLCKFLGVPKPKTKFPHANSAKDFFEE